jgi:CHAD domain-containing protein
MFHDLMLDWFRSRLKKIDRNIGLALERDDPEALHELRVDLKRLRAFFDLVQALNPDFDSRRRFSRFRKLSRCTAGLRDTGVQLDLLRGPAEGLDCPDFAAFLERSLAACGQEFHQSGAAERAKLGKSLKAIRCALEGVGPEEAEGRALERFEALHAGLTGLAGAGEPDEEVLHRVRIQAKEVHFTLRIVQRCFHLLEDRKDFIRQIRKVHRCLGRWHDLEISLFYLDGFGRECPEEAAAAPYSRLREKLVREREALKDGFRAAFDRFLKAAGVPLDR